MRSPFFHKALLVPLLTGLLARILFFFFGASLYYGNEIFYIGGDTYSFLIPAKNLVDHGLLTLDMAKPEAVFSRLPGYPLFLAPFYFLLGDTPTMFITVCWTQILMDVCSIGLIFHITLSLFGKQRIAWLAAMLYATYPFMIVWTSIVYAETTGIFLCLLAFFVATRDELKHPLPVGVLLAAAFFVRPQLLFLLPAFGIASLFYLRKKFWKTNLLLLTGFLLLYAAWPLRNLLLHDKLVPFRDITTMRAWQDDVLNFHTFMTGVQVDWEPQMTQLISGEEITFPSIVFTSTSDSLKLLRAVELSRTCSDGFASFMGKQEISNPCTEETARLWEELTISQKKENGWNYYFCVPLKGLKKAIFKLHLVSNWKSVERSTAQVVLISALFLWRTFLVLAGLAGAVMLLRKRISPYFIAVILSFFVLWYGWLCFVTRYLEIRYFLPVDILLLIPAAYLLVTLSAYRRA